MVREREYVCVCVREREREREREDLTKSIFQVNRQQKSIFHFFQKRKKFEKCLSKTFKLLSPEEQGTGTHERERERERETDILTGHPRLNLGLSFFFPSHFEPPPPTLVFTSTALVEAAAAAAAITGGWACT